jgi:MamI restriction endonuclease
MTDGHSHYRLGTVAASEAVIRDLYLKLRTELFNWASVTYQTPQPRMGYIGQHLTSVVTGYPGGRSGARGKDLILPGNRFAEIKTCYRVDQLGSCAVCRELVASIELACPVCGSSDIVRKDDSKWLISPKHDADMRSLFDPAAYYLVLFDFEDLKHPTVINARIWEVDPRRPGFAYCLVDYYFKIRARSISGAPFNLWPFQLKFQLMEPTLIYHAKIDSSNNIVTLVFPNELGAPQLYELAPLTEFSRSSNLTPEAIVSVSESFAIGQRAGVSKLAALHVLEAQRRRQGWPNSQLVRSLVRGIYGDLAEYREWLPE